MHFRLITKLWNNLHVDGCDHSIHRTLREQGLIQPVLGKKGAGKPEGRLKGTVI